MTTKRKILTAAVLMAALAAAAHAAEPQADKGEPPVDKLRELRVLAKRWRYVRAQLFVNFPQDDGTLRLEGEVYWQTPGTLSVFLGPADNRQITQAYVWSEDLYWEYDAEDGTGMKVDVRALRRQVPAEILARHGLLAGIDPFQGFLEDSIRLRGEEELNGEKTLLFEARQWRQFQSRDTEPVRALLWVGAKDGLLRRCEYFDADGARSMSEAVVVLEKGTDDDPRRNIPRLLEAGPKITDKTAEALEWLKMILKQGETAPKEGGAQRR